MGPFLLISGRLGNLDSFSDGVLAYRYSTRLLCCSVKGCVSLSLRVGKRRNRTIGLLVEILCILAVMVA